MPIQVRKGGDWKELSGIKVRSGGSWRTIRAVKVYEGAAWRTVATFSVSSGGGGGGTGGTGGSSGGGGTTTSDPMTLAAAPTPVERTNTGSTQTSPTITATPTGGHAPYTYAWSRVSGHACAFSAGTSASTGVTVTGLGLGEITSSVVRCVVTDSVGSTATSNSVTANFERVDLSGLG